MKVYRATTDDFREEGASTRPRRSSFHTADPLEAREFIDRAYGAKIQVKASGSPKMPIDFEQVVGAQVSVAELAVEFELDFELIGQGHYVFTTLHDGSVEHDGPDGPQRFRRGDTFLAVTPEGEERGRSDRAHARTVMVPAPLLEAAADRSPEDRSRPLKFLSQRPLADGGRRWQAAIDFFDSVLADPDTCTEPLVVAPAARLLAAVALTVFPNDAVTEGRPGECRDAHPESLRRAIAFIDADPARDITVAEMASAASVTPRTIQLAFRRHLDLTPTAYLRKVRLAEAHRRLREASPGDGTSVDRVAVEWGFARPSRFAVHYRAAYGRMPSETLAG